jgi:hypothetical protein
MMRTTHFALSEPLSSRDSRGDGPTGEQYGPINRKLKVIRFLFTTKLPNMKWER